MKFNKWIYYIVLLLGSFCTAQTSSTKIALATYIKSIEQQFDIKFSYAVEDISGLSIEKPTGNLNLKETIDYLQPRLSKQVQLITNFPNEALWVAINPALHSWTMENLYKNAVDAMRGKGTLQVDVHLQEKMVQIFVSDTGKGIPKSKFQTVFEPGYTTRQRGWGLGLSLVKRIIENYHMGKIFVKDSTVGKGSTFRIILNA